MISSNPVKAHQNFSDYQVQHSFHYLIIVKVLLWACVQLLEIIKRRFCLQKFFHPYLTKKKLGITLYFHVKRNRNRKVTEKHGR